MGAIRLGILNCVLIGIIGASEVVTFAEKCLNAGQHMVIFDDNIKGMYIGRGSGDKKKRQVAFRKQCFGDRGNKSEEATVKPKVI